MVRFFITVCVFLLCAVSCATEPPQMQTKFDPELHRPFAVKGNNTVKGKASIHLKHRVSVTCAQGDVVMAPATPFFNEFISHWRYLKDPKFIESLDPEYRFVVVNSQCDIYGTFTLEGLPNGRWYLLVEVPNQGILMKIIGISNGETKEVVLTEKDLMGGK